MICAPIPFQTRTRSVFLFSRFGWRAQIVTRFAHTNRRMGAGGPSTKHKRGLVWIRGWPAVDRLSSKNRIDSALTIVAHDLALGSTSERVVQVSDHLHQSRLIIQPFSHRHTFFSDGRLVPNHPLSNPSQSLGSSPTCSSRTTFSSRGREGECFDESSVEIDR